MKRHVVIIGAGIVGVSTALWLQRDGCDVTVIDKAGPGEGTSHGNGGVLASCSVVPVTVPGLLKKAPRMLFDPNQPLFMRSSYLPKLLPWLVRYLRHANASDTERIATALHGVVGDSLAEHQALARGTPAEKWIVPSDYLYLYKNRQAFEADAFGWSIRRKHGIIWDEFEGRDFHAYDPIFTPELDFAIRMGNHGCISDPGRYVKDLAAKIMTGGGRILNAEATDIVRENGHVTGVRAGGEILSCDVVVIATGVLVGATGRKAGLESAARIRTWIPPRALGAFGNATRSSHGRCGQVRRDADGRPDPARRDCRIRRTRRATLARTV